MPGKPVFKGTRLTVDHILRELGTGISPDELLDGHPGLKPEQRQVADQFAADVRGELGAVVPRDRLIRPRSRRSIAQILSHPTT